MKGDQYLFHFVKSHFRNRKVVPNHVQFLVTSDNCPLQDFVWVHLGSWVYAIKCKASFFLELHKVWIWQSFVTPVVIMSPRWHNKSRAATSAFEMFFWDWKVRFLEGVFLPYVSTSLEMEWRRQKSLQNCRWMKVECRAQSELGMREEGEKWSRLTLY